MVNLIQIFHFYNFALLNGFLPKHANKKLAELKANRKIEFQFKPVVNNIHKINSESIKVI